jgi:N-acetylglucosaminyl-diphospho-decaprenol L-rhamnosyltransferase
MGEVHSDPEISIAIVGHQHRAYLDRALSSLFKREPRRSMEVIYVDNDSRDGSAEFVQSAFPQVRLIRNLRRCGLARNNNLAFGVSRGRYFLILNPDVDVQPGAVETMADFLDERPEVGLVGPKLIFPDGNLQLSCRQFPTLRSFVWRRTPLRLLLPEGRRDESHLMADHDHSAPSPVDWLLGAALMLRREVYKKLGGMDERYELYCEDIDLCYRVHASDLDVYYVPDAVVVHHHLAVTDKKFLTRRSLSHYKSMLQYIRGHGVRLA